MENEQKTIRQTGGIKKMWILFAIFMGLFLVNFLGIRLDENATASAWTLLVFCVIISSIVMLIKNKLPNKKQIGISLVLGVLVLIAGFGVNMSIHFGMLPMAIVTTLCASAMFSIFNRYPDNAMKLLKSNSVKSVVISIVIGIAVGVVLGVVNLFLSGEELNLTITPSAFIVALNPGVFEELALRAFIYAFCLYLMRGEITSKAQNFTLWFMMIVPHVLIHTPDVFIYDGILAGMQSAVFLTVLFGFPFAFLQRKVDITSAMIAHGVVIAIRFSFLGIPM